MKLNLQLIFASILLVSTCTLFSSCSHDDWYADDNVLTDASHGSLTNHHVVATGEAQNVTHNSATILFSANYNYKKSLGIIPVIIYSDRYSDSYGDYRLDYNDKYASRVEINDFTSSECQVTLTNLKPSTTYYYRAYSKNGFDNYGEVKSFKTSFDNSIIDAVDLGLSVKWATVNIGASQPEETGVSYFWGQTTTSNSKDWHEYSQSTLKSQGYIDSNDNLCPSHDTATDAWGGSWRMPTEDEFRELKDNCEWKEVKKNGKDVFLITGPNSNVMYLPIANHWSSTCGGSGSYYFHPYRYYSYNSYSLYVETVARGAYYYVRPVRR